MSWAGHEKIMKVMPPLAAATILVRWSRGSRERGTVVEQEGKVQRGRPRRPGDTDAHRQR